MLKMIGMIGDSEVGAALAYVMLVNYVHDFKGVKSGYLVTSCTMCTIEIQVDKIRQDRRACW